jgi:hypothetical protein
VKNTPSGRSLEDQVEACWLWLLDHRGEHEFWLTPGGRLRHGPREAGAVAIGRPGQTFNRQVSLFDFRHAVYDAYSNLKAAVHGVGHG